MPFNNFELIQNYIFCVYVLYIDIPYMRKGDQNTKPHLIFESTRKKSEGPRLKPQNYIVFISMVHILMLILQKRIIRYQNSYN